MMLFESEVETSTEVCPESAEKDGPAVVERFCDETERSRTMLTGFAKLYEKNLFTDVILCAGRKEFPCHKNVLAISSPYFMAMFTNDMAEKNQKKITLRSIDSQTAQLVLDYIYTGSVMLSKDTVQELLSAANIFQLVSLKTGCASFMKNHVDVSNCIGVYFFALAHGCMALSNVSKTIINQEFSRLYRENEFLNLPADKVVEIISDDNICISQEEVVYEACMAWLKHDINERVGSLDVILNHVRFANINSYYFCDKIDSDLSLLSYENVQKTLHSVRLYYMLKNRHLELGLNLMPRRGMDFKRGIVIIANPYAEDPQRKYGAMEILFPKTGNVRYVCKLPQGLCTPGCAVTGDNQIFVAGGTLRKVNYRGSQPEGLSSNLVMFDQVSASWIVKARMKSPRTQFCLTIVDGYMYAIGGQDGTEVLSSVEQYNFLANEWISVAGLPQPLRCLASVAFRGNLYVFGGENNVKISDKAYKYCPKSNVWTELPSMSSPRALCGSVVHKDKIYVIGGNAAVSEKWRREFIPEHCVSSVEIFDPETESWSMGPELPNALCGAGCVSYDGKVLTVGGEDDKSWMAGLCWLQEDSNGQEVWMEGQELPTVMSTFGCVVANLINQLNFT
ncbi:kelch-like protein diablo [Octopus bimaculoides]|uniref:BTB domain-containing protein n=1 Tax=Octopus bimaculoides TaxID=37653 RepID=A0A0L8GBU2_OCTBM|nr:kelch-like protein diablo [Octopus bimaculoides]XP_014782729.1 kelch-like protein diablo [Octopus bimaculoides]|eukprot:XP_014782728.1 PREDICTED: kelch-like protein diablo [Octopus bimaculoides]